MAISQIGRGSVSGSPMPPEFTGILRGGDLTPNGQRIAAPGPVASGMVGERLRTMAMSAAGVGGGFDGVA